MAESRERQCSRALSWALRWGQLLLSPALCDPNLVRRRGGGSRIEPCNLHDPDDSSPRQLFIGIFQRKQRARTGPFWVAPKLIPDKASHPNFPQNQSIEDAKRVGQP